jgi:phosphatidate cytidylyltransferase
MTSSSAAPTAPQPSRAGRNLPAAIAVGLALVAVIIASLFVVKEAFLAVVLAAAALGIQELRSALTVASVRLPVVPVGIGGAGMLVGAYYVGAEAVAVAMALTLVGLSVWRLAGGAEGFVRDASAGAFVAAYVPLLGSFVLLMLAERDGAWRVVTFIAVTAFSDIGGYAAGVLFGRHAMAPRISPKKSWEGFAGSILTSMVAGWALVTLALDGPGWLGVLLGAVVAVTATTGDLVESVIKRDLGIKDMGTLLPGHGGVMDRLDSLLVVAPVSWLLLQLLEVT